MKHYTVHVAVSITDSHASKRYGEEEGTVSGQATRTMTDSTVRTVIQRNRDATGVPPTWSMFSNRLGQRIEKCAFEYERNGFRMSKVFWINRGHEYR